MPKPKSMRTLLLQIVVAVALVTSVRGDDRQKSYELRHSWPRRGIPGTWETDTNPAERGSIWFVPLVEPNELTKPTSTRDEYWLNHGTETPAESGGMNIQQIALLLIIAIVPCTFLLIGVWVEKR